MKGRACSIRVAVAAAAVAVLLSACQSPASSALPVGDAAAVAKSEASGASGRFEHAVSVFDTGSPSAVSVAAAIDAAAPGLRLPDPAGPAGTPIRAVTLGDDKTPNDRVGLAVLYPAGVRLVVTPQGRAPDYSNTDKAPTPWADGRAKTIEFTTIGKVKVAIQKGGDILLPDGGKDTMMAAVSWMDGSTFYVLESDPGDANVERLLSIVRSMY